MTQREQLSCNRRHPSMAGEAADASDDYAAGLSRSVTPVLGVPYAVGLKRILILEDGADCAEAIADCLIDHGYFPQVVTTGEQAVATALRDAPALALIDVQLAGESGFDVAERFRSERKLASVPILFVSGVPQLAAHVRQHHRPDWDFLAKPYRTDELIARVERSLASAEVIAALRQQARIDDLTGLANSRLLEERMGIETARALRYGTPLSLVVADLDGLKRINDRHGHVVGSDVLRAVGAAIQAQTRETDVASRYGGDEFVVLLPHTGPSDGLAFANRLCSRVHELRPQGVEASVSIGVGAFDPHVDRDVRALFARTDEAAYEAKRLGGNRVVEARAHRTP